MKVFLKTFGCQMNEYESAQVRERLLEHGYSFIETETEADMILFMTCSVRQHAEDRVFGRLEALKNEKKKRPDLIIGLMGCMANAYNRELIEKYPCLDFIVGTKDYDRIVPIVNEIKEKRKREIYISDDEREFNFTYNANDSVLKAFVPIMHGCNNFCTYCIVPYVRGREVSRQADDIIKEINMLTRRNVKEVMLLGQNVNSYGKGLKERIDFVTLLERIAQKTDLKRLRFMTSHPKDIVPELFDVMARNKCIEKHLHLPVQSGSNILLEAMNRGYTRERYCEIVRIARKTIPEIGITTDIIVGFCGETEKEYNDTKELVEDIRFDDAFIFKYSPRKGTKAFAFADTVPDKEKRRRNNELLKLQKKIAHEKKNEFVGSICNVLLEAASKKNKKELKGRTSHNHEVVCRASHELIGKLVNVRLERVVHETFVGTIV